MTLGTKLRGLRTKKRLSQKEVADQIGLSQPNYCKLEADEVKNHRLDIIEKLSELFEVPFNDLSKLCKAEENNCHIEQTNQHNDKVITGKQITLNFTDEEVVAMYKDKVAELHAIIKLKDEIIAFKDEKIEAQQREIEALRSK